MKIQIESFSGKRKEKELNDFIKMEGIKNKDIISINVSESLWIPETIHLAYFTNFHKEPKTEVNNG